MKKIIKKILAPIIREVMSDAISGVKELKSMQKSHTDAIGQTSDKLSPKKAIALLQEIEKQNPKPCPALPEGKSHKNCKRCNGTGQGVYMEIARARYKRDLGQPLSQKEKQLLLIFQEPIDCNQ